MTQKELEQKVIDAEGRVAKREAVLKKHNSQLAKMIEKGADRHLHEEHRPNCPRRWR